ncbi:ABC transporter substrate-binding protein [Conexibacter stalactiti]|uniref:ABC transporter substrate-binding protein n=1 Tax=Conexibacter stalactiti TaxID=1940611 RepID=A0ABU4HN98_9ACTN|nr:ABC transporter substrate-binding protein [Conexibacter stalactiti]MDW5594775.1 ABC transporter substrate-binding protein [Conexibacter stalactiti]MEC5035417.1 ABC transporter substrate-binding protein [Conexibacter stalactiti]
MYAAARTRRLLAVGAGALVLGLAGCGSDDDDGGGGGTTTTGGGGAAQAPADTSFELTIGDLVPLTGDLSPFGPPGRKSADLAISQIEEAVREAGVDTTVSIEHRDTESSPQSAVQAARQMISGGAACLAGPWASSETLAVAESVASRQRTPIISPSSTDAAITDLDDDGFVWRTAPSDNLQSRALADTVERELGGTDFTLSLAARNDAYGQGFIEKFRTAWEEKGGRTTGPVLYDPEQPSYNSEAAEIVAGNPDAYVIIDFFETYGKMGASLVRTGEFDAGRLFTADGLASDRIPDTIPLRALAGARGTRPGAPESGATVEEFARIYRAAGGAPRQTFDAQHFDATMLCYLGALAAGSADGAEIAEQLQAVSGPPGRRFTFLELADGIRAIAAGEEVDFDGVTGPIDFDDNGDPTAATYEVYRYGADGVLRVERQFEASAAER